MERSRRQNLGGDPAPKPFGHSEQKFRAFYYELWVENVDDAPDYRHIETGYEFKPDAAGNLVGNFYTKKK